MSISDVCLLLAEEEATAAEDGVVSVNNISASSFVHMGLEIEEQQ